MYILSIEWWKFAKKYLNVFILLVASFIFFIVGAISVSSSWNLEEL